MPADLHLHTTASDGTLSPGEMVRAGAAAGLIAVAITDHDVTDGLAEAATAAAEYDIELIDGVEINTTCDGVEVHILGYFVDAGSPQLQSALAEIRNGREVRARHIVARLREMSINISYEHVLQAAGGRSICRPHIAQVLVDLGEAESLQGAFRRYLRPHCPAYVPRAAFATERAITAIRLAGGMPVLAHPALTHHDEIVPRLIAQGLLGIEVAHTDHKPSVRCHYEELAERRGLLKTGGSDSHGPHGVRPVPVGSVTIPDDWVEALRRARELTHRG